MEIESPQVLASLSSIKAEAPANLQPAFDQLASLYQNKLWHQLSVSCEAVFAEPSAPKPLLVRLFREFISKWSKKMNQLTFTMLAVRVAQFLDAKEALEMLDELAGRIKSENLAGNLPVSYILARVEAAQYFLRLKDEQGKPQSAKTREYLEECQELMDTMAVSLPIVIQASFYRVSALFDKATLNYSQFYKDTLMYVACLKEGVTLTARVDDIEMAHDLCIAALLGEETYNFGELLGLPILQVLTGTPFEFLKQLLIAFNAGNLKVLTDESSPLFKAVKAHSALSANLEFLHQKLCLLALVNLLFTEIKNNRRVSFERIAASTQVPLDQVEFLLIKSMSSGLVRGLIDQVQGDVTVEWIQPRVLDGGQLGELLTAVEAWKEKVATTVRLVQQLRASA